MIFSRVLPIFTFALILTVVDLRSQAFDTMPFWPVDQYSEVSPDPDFLSKYEVDSAFDYGVLESDQSISFREWLRNKFRELLLSTSRSTRSIIQRIIVYGLIIFMVIAISLHLTRSRFDPLMGKGDQKILARQLLNRDVEPEELRQQLDSYVKNGQWDVAIRAVYLLALQSLGQSGMIKLSNAKTNKSYLNEIQQIIVRQLFEKIVNLFEYDWYGGFEVLEDDAELAIASLEELEVELKKITKSGNLE
jgi:hypothetical protein